MMNRLRWMPIYIGMVACSPDTVPPCQTLELKVTYQAGDAIEFEENITVHSNAAGSPLQFVVNGEAR